MRLMRLLAAAVAFAAIGAAPLRAEYVVFRSGQRISVTGYELRGDTYRLQISGGVAEVPATEVLTIEPEEVFRAVPQPAPEAAPYTGLVHAAAERYGVDADLISSVIAIESNFNPRAVSRRDARGLMQLLPETAARMGVTNILDPRENIEGGTRYLRELLQRYQNDLVLTLAAYNAGPDRVQFYGRVPPFAETRSYVLRVKRAYDQRKAQHSAQPEEHLVPSEQAASRNAPL